MLGIIAALALVATLVAIATTMRTDAADTAVDPDAPKRLPKPGARDVYTVSPGTLGRAYVPTWG